MSRKQLELLASTVANTINTAEKNTKKLISLGVPENVARMHAPKPEAKVFVSTLRSLFGKMDSREITTKDHILAELEQAYIDFWFQRSNAASASVDAVKQVALALFAVSNKEITDLGESARERVHGVRHGWNGVLGD